MLVHATVQTVVFSTYTNKQAFRVCECIGIDVYKRNVIAWDKFATHTIWIAQVASGINAIFMNHYYDDDDDNIENNKNGGGGGGADSNQLHIDSNLNFISNLTGTNF